MGLGRMQRGAKVARALHTAKGYSAAVIAEEGQRGYTPDDVEMVFMPRDIATRRRILRDLDCKLFIVDSAVRGHAKELAPLFREKEYHKVLMMRDVMPEAAAWDANGTSEYISETFTEVWVMGHPGVIDPLFHTHLNLPIHYMGYING